MSSDGIVRLKRMLQPRHVAVIGGDDAGIAVQQCVGFGFDGPVWAVNRKREYLGGQRCYRDIDDLPEAPDLVFVGVSSATATAMVRRLREQGAGGVICFSAGYAETGEEGARGQDALAAAAGDMPLLGPNCYGLINCTRKVAVWPYLHGCGFTNAGAALISQSGMLATSLTMNRRSVAFSHVISVGNQAVLGAEDFIEALLGDPAVSAFLLYLEGIRDANRFVEAVVRSRVANKPIVLLRAGAFAAAAAITRHHTGMTAITRDYLDRLRAMGVITASSPVGLLETGKMLMHSTPVRGLRMAAFTCSGGDAAVLADSAQAMGIELPRPTPAVAARLRRLIPDIATVFNPLDCTTQLWGRPEIGEVFATMLQDDYDIAVFVQDYPRPDISFDPRTDLREAKCFAEAAAARGIPAVICSVLAENLGAHVRDHVYSLQAVPLQGVTEAMQAIVEACRFHRMQPAAVAPGRRGTS